MKALWAQLRAAYLATRRRKGLASVQGLHSDIALSTLSREMRVPGRRAATSHKIEAHADFNLGSVARKSDVTLGELRGLLSEKGVQSLFRRSGGSSTAAGSHSKKTAHASEESRPDILKRRKDSFDGQLSSLSARRAGLGRSRRKRPLQGFNRRFAAAHGLRVMRECHHRVFVPRQFRDEPDLHPLRLQG